MTQCSKSISLGRLKYEWFLLSSAGKGYFIFVRFSLHKSNILLAPVTSKIYRKCEENEGNWTAGLFFVFPAFVIVYSHFVLSASSNPWTPCSICFFLCPLYSLFSFCFSYNDFSAPRLAPSASLRLLLPVQSRWSTGLLLLLLGLLPPLIISSDGFREKSA